MDIGRLEDLHQQATAYEQYTKALEDERAKIGALKHENDRLRGEIILLNELLDSAHTRLARARDLCSRSPFCAR